LVNIQVLDPNHELWPDVLAHLDRTDNLRWLTTSEGKLRCGLSVIAAIKDRNIVGHLSVLRQKLTLPEGGGVLTHDGRDLWEAFVQTFEVESEYQSQGIGTRLQEAAIEETRRLGCYQLRSWSSYDKAANYRVKLRLGFAFQPGVHVVEKTGERIPGGHFIMKV